MPIFSTKHASTLKNLLPSFLYKLGAQAFIDKDYPRHLFIETTAACNLSCSYCPRERESSSMDFELFKQIIDEATGYGPRSFSLHLFGEPLLYPRIFEACAYIKQRNKSHTILLTTNGTRINSCIDDLISSGVDQVFWTWRTEARFRESTLLKLRKWGKFRVRFIDEITTEEARKEWKDWPNIERRHLHNYASNIDLKRWNVREPQSLQACYHLWLAPAVAWNGKILLCCSDPRQEESLGQYPLESVASVWKGSKLASIRESHLRREFKGICSGCTVKNQYPDIFFSWQYTGSSSSGNSSPIHTSSVPQNFLQPTSLSGEI